MVPNAELLKRLDVHGHECAIGAPVWHELTYGTRRLARGKRRTALESYLHDVVLASFLVLAYDEIAAQWHGHERARLSDWDRRRCLWTVRLPPLRRSTRSCFSP